MAAAPLPSRPGAWADATEEGCEHFASPQVWTPLMKLQDEIALAHQHGRLAGKYEWEAWVGAVMDPKACPKQQLLGYIQCRTQLTFRIAAGHHAEMDWYMNTLRVFPLPLLRAIAKLSLTDHSADNLWSALHILTALIAGRRLYAPAVWSPAMCNIASTVLAHANAFAQEFIRDGNTAAAQRVRSLPTILHAHFM